MYNVHFLFQNSKYMLYITGTSDPYVTVQVGKTNKKTRTILQDLNPKWNQSFSFDCNNSSDRIKVRVWDEDDDFKSKVMTHLRREADDFLGQAIIDVKQLCGETDVWLDLKQRTDRSDVSGQIHLKMMIKIEGEEQNASYHIQYQILHETLFKHLCEINHGVLLPNSKRKLKGDETDEWPMFFDGQAQDIVEEFATRYGIESIFMAMTQFSCLTQRFISKKDAPAQSVSELLVLINAHYSNKHGQEINVSNFGVSCYIFHSFYHNQFGDRTILGQRTFLRQSCDSHMQKGNHQTTLPI